MSSPPYASEYSNLGPSSTSSHGTSEAYEEHHYHPNYLSFVSACHKPSYYGTGFSDQIKPTFSEENFVNVSARYSDHPIDEQVMMTFGQSIKEEPYDYEESVDLCASPKKRGRKKKEPNVMAIKQETPLKQRKRMDRFDGMPEEEVMKKSLPDHLSHGLDIVIIGINPGLMAAYKGHHYAGPGNHFWKCLFLAGLIPNPMTAVDDFKLISHGIGFTNVVSRPTKGSADLNRKEIREGAEILLSKLREFQPKIAVFNGKMIYEVFSGKKNFDFGRQPDPIQGTGISIFVMPSSSARCAQLPRATDKVPFYVALKKLRDHLCGSLPKLDFSEVSFPHVKLKVEMKDDSCSKNEVKAPIFENVQTSDSGVIPKKRGRKPKADSSKYFVGSSKPKDCESDYSKPRCPGQPSWTVSSPYFPNETPIQQNWQGWPEKPSGRELYFFDDSQRLSPPQSLEAAHTSMQSFNNQYYSGYERPFVNHSQNEPSINEEGREFIKL